MTYYVIYGYEDYDDILAYEEENGYEEDILSLRG